MSISTSFAVDKNGSVSVKLLEKETGYIQYFFKGKKMSSEKAEVINKINQTNMLVVKTKDLRKLNFVNINGTWLMEAHLSPNSLLYGTKFVYE